MSNTQSFGPRDIRNALREGFPHDPDVDALEILSVDENGCEIRLDYDERLLRPGGTISGPTLMKLADTAMYAAVMGAFQSVPRAYTTNLSIEFMRRLEPGDILARAELIKHRGRRLTGRVDLFGATDDAVASALVSYQVVESA